MSESILEINIDDLVRNAFYSLPDMVDDKGDSFGGVYGAFFYINDKLSVSDHSEIEFSLSDDFSNEILIIKTQTERVKSLLSSVEGINLPGKSAIDDKLKENISAILSSLSAGGSVCEIPRFKFESRITSDLNEVEDIFKSAMEFALKNKNSYISYYFLTEKAPGKISEKRAAGLSLSYDEALVYYIPVENFITEDYLGKKLSALSEVSNLVTFDIKESFRYFTPHEIAVRTIGAMVEDKLFENEARCFDTLIAAYLLNPLKSDYEPWDICSEYLSITMEKRSDVFGKNALSDMDESVLAGYSSKICAMCLKSAPILRQALKKTEMEELFYNIEMPLSYILYAMEKEGIIAQKDALKEYGDKLTGRISELEKAIYEEAGCEFNINSPKQLGEVLFERLHLPAEKKTKSGYSTAADVLEKLAPDHKIVADILEYRGLAKLKSTYADGLLAYIEDDGRIHTSFNQTITATGRISSTEPNLQNIPMRTELGRLIRKVFVPKEGYVFADADYSQVELRILAHMSGDKGLIDAYNEGMDIHSITASKVFHVPFEEVTPLQRRNAKAVNFGIVYGISSFGLSQDLSISVSEAKEYMDKYFETYPGVRAYQDRAILEAKNKGYSETLFNRRRPVPELKSGNFNMRQFGERVAMNAPIQGTAADIMKIAMINVFFRLKREDLKSRLILQIHDELVIETAPDEIDKVCEILSYEMEKAADLLVALEAECHTGSDWYEAK